MAEPVADTFEQIPLKKDSDGILRCIGEPSVDVSNINTMAKALMSHNMLIPPPIPPPDMKLPPTRIGVQVKKMKESGNEAFSRKKYPDAKRLYSLAIEMALKRPIFEVPTLLRDELVPLLCNRSICCLHIEEYPEALADACTAIQLKPDFSKAYFRKGQALSKMERYDEAADAFREGLSLDPKNNDIAHALRVAEEDCAKSTRC